jgi:hypothetical protein
MGVSALSTKMTTTRTWLNLGVLMGVVGLITANAARPSPSRVVAGNQAQQLAVLEDAAARSPSAESLTPLVKAYLRDGRAGHAVAALERSPAAAVASPALADLASQAYVTTGRASHALVLARRTLDLCSESDRPCDMSLVSRAARREELLSALVEMGVEDPLMHPDAVELAQRRVVRQVRIAMN